MTQHRIPPARGSAQTLVGMQASAGNGNGNGDSHPPMSGRMTPPKGMAALTPESFAELPTKEALSLIGIELAQQIDTNLRNTQAVEANGVNLRALQRAQAERYASVDGRLDSIGGKVDACIQDIRDYRAEQRKDAEAYKAHFDAFTADLMRSLAADKRELKDAINQVSKKSNETHALIGTLPEKVNLERLSSHGDATAEELVAAERGTGILGMLGRLVARDVRAAKQLAQEAGRSAGRSAGVVSSVVTTVATTSPVWGPPLFEAAKRVFGG